MTSSTICFNLWLLSLSMLKFCYLAVSVLGLTYIAYAIRRSNQPLFGSSDVFDDQIMANYAICLFVF